MIAVGIDVSKSKSTVAILNGDGSIRAKPFDVHHVADELQALVDYIKRTSEPPTILMEPTSHYHYPLLKAFTEAELPVCLINPYQMKKYGDTELRKAKTDKRDSLRIAQYALEKSYSLIPYTPQDQKYEDLRFLSRQYSQRISTLTVAKLLRFIKRFKSFDVIRKMGKTRFLDSYQVLVKKTKDRFAGSKGLAIYELVLNSITTRGENPLSAITQDQCVDLVSTAQKAADEINLQMRIIAETIPEYKVLRSMAGVGDRLGPIILGEIGDVRRFHSGKALNAYAGNDAPPYQSGQFESRNRHISKRGNPALRKACFEVMQALKLTKPQDDPVYLFLLKKEQEGKPYNVAKMAAVNKFLRIYYARAMELYK